jgi:hypothetical protein
VNRRKLFQVALLSVATISLGSYSIKRIMPTVKLRRLSGAIELTGKVDRNSSKYLQLEKLFRDKNFNLKDAISNDFLSSRVINVDGWCLSETECYHILFTNLN